MPTLTRHLTFSLTNWGNFKGRALARESDWGRFKDSAMYDMKGVKGLSFSINESVELNIKQRITEIIVTYNTTLSQYGVKIILIN